jgi:predicted Zn-ribbon and HTH transcriptional regulator
MSLLGVVWMCSVGGALNLDIEELRWIKYQCNNCGKVYKSTGKKSVCPKCKSDNVDPI